MNAMALNHLWTYIESLGLSAKNRKWLADKLVEPTSGEITPDLQKRLDVARKDIKEGRCAKCTSPEELQSFLASL